jgi:hypothetical protein
VEEVALVLGGGINALVIGVKEIGVEEVVEAAEGETIDMMPGAYFFAFLKKLRSSERGRPREELTFSQLTSCVTTQDFIKFWGKFFVFILLVLIENSQGFKTF